MKLLDAAEEITGEFPWNGYSASSRECSVTATLDNPCPPVGEPTPVPLVTPEAGASGPYSVQPFSVNVSIRRSTGCMADDDEQWLTRVIRAQHERAFGAALAAMPFTGYETSFNSAGVRTATAATPSTLLASVLAARSLWLESVVTDDPDGGPIMHVHPALVPALIDQRILDERGDSDFRSNVGPYDSVVVSDGFLVADPAAFGVAFTGPVRYGVSSVDSTGVVVETKINDYAIGLNQVGLLDVAPCSVVVLPYTAV